MLRYFSMWALICLTAPSAYSQNCDETCAIDCDSIEYSISPKFLDEVMVTASPVTNKSDRKIVRPDKVMLRISSNGMDLLRRLNLPRIAVNPMTNAITVAGGGDIILCINGVESDAAQIAAVRPSDILRIEYHDSPGVRYARATAVIDYITMHHDDGGNLSFDTFGALAKGRWATIDHLSGQYNRGRSVWSINAGYMGQRKDKWLRDYDEVWHYPEGDVTRHEDGLPVSVGQSGLESAVNYNYQHPSGNRLNIRLGLDLTDVPDQEEGDRRALLIASGAEVPVLVTEHTELHSASPDIGLYYKHKLSDVGNLVFEARGSYMRSRMLHEYSESEYTEESRVSGDKYAMNFIGIYESHRGNRAWSIGVSGNSSIIRNTYYLDTTVDIRINKSETAIFGEYSGSFENWGFKGAARSVYRNMGQGDKKIDKLFVLPSANVFYRPSGSWFMRYSASVDYKMPAAAEISDIEQPIQAGMVRRGNPALQPFRVIDQLFDASFESGLVSVNSFVGYRHEHRPVMESVIFENGQFVRTFFNQRSFQRLMVGGTVSLRLWKDHLTVAAEPRLMRYYSHGVDYNHCHNIFRIGLNVDLSYGKWLAYANVMSGPANYMYGEEIIEEKDMNQIMAGYRHNIWSIHLGVFNAFMNSYWMETRNLSALAPYTSKAHSARSSSYVALKFNLALDFGRGAHDVEPLERDIDNDPEILTGIK